MKKRNGYTLLEVILSVIIFSLLIGVIISIYVNIKQADGSVAGKRIMVSEASDLFDTIHEAAIDFTIDYEEYFNRKGLGYGVGDDGFTSYGNDGEWYYCVNNLSNEPLTINKKNQSYQIRKRDNGKYGCVQKGKNQKYLEYKFQHWMLTTGGNLNDISNSGANVGHGPVAVDPNIGLNYLYLISNDKTERYYFRRVEKGGKGVIQALRLVGFDAGTEHNFNSWGAFDGFIDTWACDTSKGFVCKEKSAELGGYGIPMDKDDGWQDITSNKINVKDFKVDVFPIKDPYLSNESDNIMDPYIKISITLGIDGNEEEDFTLSTTLSFKNTYSNF